MNVVEVLLINKYCHVKKQTFKKIIYTVKFDRKTYNFYWYFSNLRLSALDNWNLFFNWNKILLLFKPLNIEQNAMNIKSLFNKCSDRKTVI